MGNTEAKLQHKPLLEWTEKEWQKKLRFAKKGGVFLTFFEMGMNLAGAQRLAKALGDNPKLARGIRLMRLVDNPELGDAGLAAVAEGLAAVAALGGGEEGGGGSGSGGGIFALEVLWMTHCGLKDLSGLLASSSSDSKTVRAESSWLSGLKTLVVSGNSLTEFPATLCGELTSLKELYLNDNRGGTLRLPAELWWLPKGCDIYVDFSKGLQVARGPEMSGGFVDVPLKFTGSLHGIHDMLAELNIEEPSSGYITKSANKR